MCPYFHICDDLVVQDGLILRGDRLVVPKALRKQMMEELHASHQGVESTLRRAKEITYWPNMKAELSDYISKCDTCCAIGARQSKETLISHDIPDHPWAKIATDLFEHEHKDYLVTVDYFSNFFGIDHLYTTSTTAVIRKIKGHIARYGVPDVIVSDQGPQFTSGEFQQFCSQYGISHTVTSPYHQQANGKAEAAVKQAKRILKMSRASERDPHLALLNLQNTPLAGHDTSPAQRLLSIRTKTTLPTSECLLKPHIVTDTHQKHKQQTQKQQRNYNKGAGDLPPLVEDDEVWMQPLRLGDKEWKRATVLREVTLLRSGG